MTTPHGVPAPRSIRPDDLSDGATALMELACNPSDSTLLREAADKLTPLTAILRDAAGISAGDSDWLALAGAVGVVRERTH